MGDLKNGVTSPCWAAGCRWALRPLPHGTGDVVEALFRLSPRRVVRAFALTGVVVLATVPAVRQPVIQWWVDHKTHQLTSQFVPLLHPDPSQTGQP